jgi:hypothetical protein
MNRGKYILPFVLSMITYTLKSQIIIDDTQTVFQNVIQKLATSDIPITNIRFNSDDIHATSNIINPQIGSFNSANANVGLTSGIILSNGNINSIIGPNDEDHFDLPTTNSAPTDPDLLLLSSPAPAFDGAVLEFIFTPEGDTVEFDFVFASEEYPEFVGSSTNDVFGFFVAGPGITGPYSSPILGSPSFPNGSINVALIPGTSTPVSINSINSTTNSSYYISNGDGSTAPYDSDPQYIQADGFTTPLTVKFPVQCGEQYYIKFALADVQDNQVDSYVFIGENSFSAITPVEVFAANINTSIIEGCDSVVLDFVRNGDLGMPEIVGLTIGGTATNGVDYTNLPSQITFPTGEDTISIVIHPNSDLTIEGTETIDIHVENFGTTFCGSPIESDVSITINDNVTAVMSGGGAVCPGDSLPIQIDFTGNAPWVIEYTVNSVPIAETVNTNPYIIYASFQEQYILTGVTANGCTGLAIGSATIVAPTTSTLNISGVTDFCSGTCMDVAMTMSGTPPFTISYKIDNIIQPDLVTSAFTETISICNSSVIEPVSIFSHSTSSCPGTITGSVTMVEHDLPVLSAPDTVAICSGVQANILFVMANGANWTIEYDYNSVPQSTPIMDVNNGDFFQTNDPGIYHFNTITSGISPFCSNTISETTVVESFSLPTASIPNMDSTICIGNTINIPVTFTGSAPWTIEYTVAGALFGPFTFSDNDEIQVNASGAVIITSITDAYCSGTSSGQANISIASPIANSTTTFFSVCGGESIDLSSNISGGIQQDYTYDWEHAGSSFSILPNTSVTPVLSDPSTAEFFSYVLTISQDACGIEYVFPYTIQLNPIPTATLLNNDIIVCPGDIVNMQSSNTGSGMLTLNYSLDNVGQSPITSFESTINFPLTTPGIYSLDSISDDHCTQPITNNTFTIANHIQPSAIMEINDTTICIGTTLLAPISFIGAAPYTFEYLIDGTVNQTITTSDNPFILSISTEGDHTIGGISDSNCSAAGEGLCSVDFHSIISIDLEGEYHICQGDEIQITPLSITGGDQDTYQYSWLQDNILISSDPILAYNPISGGVITLGVSDFCNVETNATSDISVEEYPVVMFTSEPTISCPNDLIAFDNNSIVNTTNNTFVWDLGDGTTSSLPTINHSYTAPGIYDIGLTITTPLGCASTGSVLDMISINSQPIVDFTFNPEFGDMSDPEIMFENLSTDVLYLNWNFGDGYDTNEPNPTHSYPHDRAAIYEPCLEITSLHGCSNTLCKTLEIQPIYNLFIPTAFTPDGDGINELFGPVLYTSDIDQYEFRIFDRDGHEVFHTFNPNKKWNGSYLTNSDQYALNSVYTWSISLKLKNNSDVRVSSGIVTVIR